MMGRQIDMKGQTDRQIQIDKGKAVLTPPTIESEGWPKEGLVLEGVVFRIYTKRLICAPCRCCVALLSPPSLKCLHVQKPRYLTLICAYHLNPTCFPLILYGTYFQLFVHLIFTCMYMALFSSLICFPLKFHLFFHSFPPDFYLYVFSILFPTYLFVFHISSIYLFTFPLKFHLYVFDILFPTDL